MKNGMLSLKSNLILAAAIAASCAPAAAAIDPNNISAHDKMEYALNTGTGTAGIMNAVMGISILFGVLLFSYLFFRIWRLPRMGYFIVAVIIPCVRFRLPEDVFWKAAALTAGLFSLLMFGLAYRNVDFDTRREPLYFLFIALTLLTIAFSVDFYLAAISGISLLASLFFVTTNKPVPHGKFTNLEADAKIMETLEKKAKRPL
jgi:hypothetical protein